LMVLLKKLKKVYLDLIQTFNYRFLISLKE
jgi:hypothetical protein